MMILAKNRISTLEIDHKSGSKLKIRGLEDSLPRARRRNWEEALNWNLT